MGIGRGLAVGDGYGPFEAEFVGQPAEPDNGQFEGQFPAEDIDAGSETIHVRIYLTAFRGCPHPLNSVRLFYFCSL